MLRGFCAIAMLRGFCAKVRGLIYYNGLWFFAMVRGFVGPCHMF